MAEWRNASEEAVVQLKASALELMKRLVPDEFLGVEPGKLKAAVAGFEIRNWSASNDESAVATPGWNVRVFLDSAEAVTTRYEIRCRAVDGAVGQVLRIDKLDLTAVEAQHEMRPLPVALPAESGPDGGWVLAYAESSFRLQRKDDPSIFRELCFEPVGGEDDGWNDHSKAQGGSDAALVLSDRSTPERIYLLLARYWCGVDLFVAQLDVTRGVLRVSQDRRIYDYPALVAVRKCASGWEVFLDKDDTTETRIYYDPRVMNAEMSGARMSDFYPNSGWKKLRWVDDVCRDTFGCKWVEKP